MSRVVCEPHTALFAAFVRRMLHDAGSEDVMLAAEAEYTLRGPEMKEFLEDAGVDYGEFKKRLEEWRGEQGTD